MSSPSIRVKRAVTETGRFAVSTGAPSTLSHGELAVIFPDPASATPSSLGETVYVGAVDGSAIAVGGSGTFATRAYVDDKVTSVFVYKGKITSFFPAAEATFPLNLDSTLSQVTGSYYSIDSDYPGNPENDDPGVVGTDKNAVAISWTEGSDSKTLLVKKGDSIVKTATGWEKFDNVDVEVHGTANETAVTGDENAGYTVALATEFKQRVSDVESKTQFISLSDTTNPSLSGYPGPATTLNSELRVLGLGAGPEVSVREEQIVHTGGEQFSLTAMGNVTVSANQEIGAPTLNLVSEASSEDSTINITALGPNGKTINVTATDINLNGATALTGDFSVTGDAAVSGDLAITTDLDVTGNADIGTNLTVVGASSLGGGATVTGGNLVGSGTNEITDFIIDAGTF